MPEQAYSKMVMGKLISDQIGRNVIHHWHLLIISDLTRPVLRQQGVDADCELKVYDAIVEVQSNNDNDRGLDAEFW